MSKLSKKLSVSLCIIIILVSIISIYINNLFIHKYYLYEKKNIIDNLGYEINNMDLDFFIENIENIEENYNVTIVSSVINRNDKNFEDDVNEVLRHEFYKKGITLKKFWITEEDLIKLDNKTVNKIYNQGKTKYSLLVKFLKKDKYIFAVSTVLEHSKDTIDIINKFNLLISLFSAILMIILSLVLSNKIIKPIEKLKILSDDISKLKFRTEKIKTNDEIEELSNSINTMSVKLQSAHNELKNKNKNLKRFISDASHEMKTPISLIKLYSMGIQDKMDDGTYLKTIIEQSENLNNIVNSLLYWAKYEKKESNLSKFDLKDKLLLCLKNYHILINQNNIKLILNIQDGEFYINENQDSIEVILNNLISNAIKYTTNNVVEINLLKNEEIYFSVKNGVNNIVESEINNLFKPFYVLEESRNKYLSGTGLGLTIVKEILEINNFKNGVNLKDNSIEFFVFIPN